ESLQAFPLPDDAELLAIECVKVPANVVAHRPARALIECKRKQVRSGAEQHELVLADHERERVIASAHEEKRLAEHGVPDGMRLGDPGYVFAKRVRTALQPLLGVSRGA